MNFPNILFVVHTFDGTRYCASDSLGRLPLNLNNSEEEVAVYELKRSGQVVIEIGEKDKKL